MAILNASPAVVRSTSHFSATCASVGTRNNSESRKTAKQLKSIFNENTSELSEGEKCAIAQ